MVIDAIKKGFDIIKRFFYIKTFIVFLISIFTLVYLIKEANLNLINLKLYQSLVLFLNDLNPNHNILEYLFLHFIKLIFNVDIHNLKSFFENINPLL